MQKLIVYYLFTLLLFLSGCVTATQPEAYSLCGWYLVYNADTFKICGKVGCTVPSTKTIYCYHGDDIVCGHELRHITDGNFHR